MKRRNSALVVALILLAALALPAAAKNDEHGKGSAKEQHTSSDASGSSSSEAGGSDHDGDADSTSSTSSEDDHATADGGDNAHPSGNDRSVENGGSGNQGQSESNPDDTKGPQRYEGNWNDDKAAGPGGTDTADQDGNNGCGNDDDFDDDNNGWCGNHPAATSTEQGVDEGDNEGNESHEAGNTDEGDEANEAGDTEGSDDEVLGEGIENGEGQPGEGVEFPGFSGNGSPGVAGPVPEGIVLAGTVNAPDTVLGVTYHRGSKTSPKAEAAAATRTLPFTGSSVIPFFFLGLALILVGAGLTRGAAARR